MMGSEGEGGEWGTRAAGAAVGGTRSPARGGEPARQTDPRHPVTVTAGHGDSRSR